MVYALSAIPWIRTRIAHSKQFRIFDALDRSAAITGYSISNFDVSLHATQAHYFAV